MSAPSIPDFRASLTRTLVPVLVSALIASWGAQLELFGIDGTLLTVVVTTVLTAPITMAYYAAVRALEWFRSSKFGWLLGYAKMPSYVSADVAAVITGGDDGDEDPDEVPVVVDTPGQHAAPDA